MGEAKNKGGRQAAVLSMGEGIANATIQISSDPAFAASALVTALAIVNARFLKPESRAQHLEEIKTSYEKLFNQLVIVIEAQQQEPNNELQTNT